MFAKKRSLYSDVILKTSLEYAGLLKNHEYKMIKKLEWGLSTSVESYVGSVITTHALKFYVLSENWISSELHFSI